MKPFIKYTVLNRYNYLECAKKFCWNIQLCWKMSPFCLVGLSKYFFKLKYWIKCWWQILPEQILTIMCWTKKMYKMYAFKWTVVRLVPCKGVFFFYHRFRKLKIRSITIVIVYDLELWPIIIVWLSLKITAHNPNLKHTIIILNFPNLHPITEILNKPKNYGQHSLFLMV